MGAPPDARAHHAPTYLFGILGGVFYHGALVQDPKNDPLQALTVRLPESEYRLLRALAFATDESINDLVGTAIRRLLDDPDLRAGLQGIIETAQDLRPGRLLPRNPHGKGRRKQKV